MGGRGEGRGGGGTLSPLFCRDVTRSNKTISNSVFCCIVDPSPVFHQHRVLFLSVCVPVYRSNVSIFCSLSVSLFIYQMHLSSAPCVLDLVIINTWTHTHTYTHLYTRFTDISVFGFIIVCPCMIFIHIHKHTHEHTYK